MWSLGSWALLLSWAIGSGRSYYVSPSPAGVPGGDGSSAHPWDLATALSGGHGRIQPGDTVWVRGGTYRVALHAAVHGAAGAPVVIRQYPGERAVLDAARATDAGQRGDFLVVQGDYTTWWGLEFTDSDSTRTDDARPNLIVNDASHTKYINLVVHDGGIGFYTYATRPDVEVSGC